MRDRAAGWLGLAAAAATLSGCLSISASAAFGPQLSAAVLDRIEPGQTTRKEVLALLGPPEEFLRSEIASALDDDTVRVSGAIQLGNRALDAFTWQHDRLESRGRWWLLYMWVDTTVESDILMIVFDERDTVSEVSFRGSSDE